MNGLFNEYLQIKIAHKSEQGLRTRQEDRVTVIIDMQMIKKNALLDIGNRCVEQVAFFALYDGHGGSRCASELQQKLHIELANNVNFSTNLPLALEQTFFTLDESICKGLILDSNMSGSTCLVGCMKEDKESHLQLILANVGDCKCVVNRCGQALTLTKDHRLTRHDEAIRLQKKGASIRNHRVNGILALTRSFGDVQHSKDLIAAKDVLSRIANSTWWEWKAGSRPAHWKWPKWYREIIRDGLKLWFLYSPTTWRRPQPKPTRKRSTRASRTASTRLCRTLPLRRTTSAAGRTSARQTT